MSALAVVTPELGDIRIAPDGPHLDFSRFHEGQRQAYWSDARFTLVLAGTQGGKTSIGPAWLLRQMREHGPGDYMVLAPNFPLMEKKVLPEFRRLFEHCLHLGEYKQSPVRKFVVSDAGARSLWPADQITVQTNVFFGYGEDPDSLESATIKAAWFDEPGQRGVKREANEALMRRLSIEQGPVLYTTTPYVLGWLEQMHRQAKDPASGVRVINFPSIANPRFPLDEWERAKRDLPPWKFNMFYRGLFERPAGLIYDCWDDAINIIPAFSISDHWQRFLGLDFGGVNTACVSFAKELNDQGQPTGRYIGYREYHAGGRTLAQHVERWKAGEPRTPTAVGGASSEGQWRDECAAAGLGVWAPPVTDVEVGINRLYGMIKSGQLVVFDTLTGFRDQVMDYSRVLDSNGEPTEKIADKETYHLLDAARYFAAFIRHGLDGPLFA